MKKKLNIPHSIYVSILYTGRQAVCERGRKRTRGERERGGERGRGGGERARAQRESSVSQQALQAHQPTVHIGTPAHKKLKPAQKFNAIFSLFEFCLRTSIKLK